MPPSGWPIALGMLAVTALVVLGSWVYVRTSTGPALKRNYIYKEGSPVLQVDKDDTTTSAGAEVLFTVKSPVLFRRGDVLTYNGLSCVLVDVTAVKGRMSDDQSSILHRRLT